MTETRRRWWSHPTAALLAIGMLAAACGGSGGSNEGGDAQEQPEAADPDASLTPQRGGRLVFARDAETANPWTPAGMLCDTACNQLIRGIYDTLVFLGADRQPHPFLLESFAHNDTYDEWTFTTREGIRFHDGTPFDADALVDHIERMRTNPLAAASLQPITRVRKIDDRSVLIRLDTPWTTFMWPWGGSPGFVASPTWLAAVDAGEAEATEPVGTGPFVFAEYRPGDRFRMTRNDDYWLDAPDGQPYPYLDEIEFLVQEEDATRIRSLQGGEVDLTHTDRGADIEDLRRLADDGSIDLYEMSSRPLTTFALINMGNESSVLQDVGVRRAVAQAIDQEFRNQSRSAGVFAVANGPYPPGFVGHLDATHFPEYDPDAAAAFVEEYEAEHGPIEISYRTTADPENQLSVELARQDLAAVGIDVVIDQTEQGEFIQQAALGHFEVFTWRGGGALEPDNYRSGWHSETSAPIGEIAVNFGRLEDPVIDRNLDVIRASVDEDERRTAAEAINRRFGEQVYNIWEDWIFWALPHQPDVHGLQTPLVLPDGTDAIVDGIGGPGIIGLPQLWVEG
ncbi:MAG: ABC transporter substrate-binding protein [Acidimicrobiales bacterium]